MLNSPSQCPVSGSASPPWVWKARTTTTTYWESSKSWRYIRSRILGAYLHADNQNRWTGRYSRIEDIHNSTSCSFHTCKQCWACSEYILFSILKLYLLLTSWMLGSSTLALKVQDSSAMQIIFANHKPILQPVKHLHSDQKPQTRFKEINQARQVVVLTIEILPLVHLREEGQLREMCLGIGWVIMVLLYLKPDLCILRCLFHLFMSHWVHHLHRWLLGQIVNEPYFQRWSQILPDNNSIYPRFPIALLDRLIPE